MPQTFKNLKTLRPIAIIALGLSFALYSPFIMGQTSSQSWNRDGNALDPGDFLGSTNAADLLFKTDGQVRAIFTSDGNMILVPAGGLVGIGTNAPAYTLDVSGDVHAKSFYADQCVVTDTLKASKIINVLDKVCIESDQLGGSICGKDFPLKIQSESQYNSNTLINAFNNGRVGIGTDNPQAKLDLNGNLNVSGGATITDLTIGNSLTLPLLNVQSQIKIGNSLYLLNYTTPSQTNTSEIYTDNEDLLIQSNPVTAYNRHTILNSNLNTGNVGIGTTLPTKKVHIYTTHTLTTPEPVEPSLSFGNNDDVEPVPSPLGTHNGMRLEELTIYTTSQNPPVAGVWDIEPFAKKLIMGTPNNKFFVLKDNGVNDGRVGIGTPNPRARLDITGDFVLGAPNEKFILDARNQNGDFLQITYQNGNGNWNYNQGLTLRDNGNVGIGTISPSYKFEVNGNSWISGNLCVGANNQSALLTVNVLNSGDRAFSVSNPNASQDPAQDLFVVHGNGKVSIGIPDNNLPGSFNLYVKGGALIERVKVALSNGSEWMDHVFSAEFKLMSLDELEQYISKYQHLPGIPSASDLVKEGIDVAKMDAAILGETEKNTLYIIQLKKEIDQLKQELNSLKKEQEKKKVE